MKLIHFIALTLILSFSILDVNAFKEKKGTRFVGFDGNPLLSRIIPMNNLQSNTFTASILVRRYKANNKGLRMGYGLNLSNTIDNMFFSVDYDRRFKLRKNWHYFHGFGTSLKLFSDNSFSGVFQVRTVSQQSLELGWHWGFEYNIDKVFSVSTETSLVIGRDLSGFSENFIRINMPISIMLHFKLYDN
jgi:hypothetical protein